MITIGSKIDALYALRETKRELEKKIEELSKQAGFMEAELIELMDKEGIDRSSGHRASVSITEVVKPNVQDWDTFWRYIIKNKYTHLVERRPSVTGCRELFETKGKIPGVVPYTRRSINLRTRD